METTPSYLLTAAEARVLGALIEKEITTPDYYPLSLNAVVNACNQKTNRDPVMELDEEQVRQALLGLRDHGLAGNASGAESRVTKYEHRIQEAFNFKRSETAILCVLLLRGPQTPGELRGRSERLHAFEHLDEVQSTLQRLAERNPPLVRMLPRQPGTKESRYVHLMSGEVEGWEAAAEAHSASSGTSEGEDRLARMERELSTLRDEVAGLKQELMKLVGQKNVQDSPGDEP
ncbi:MAG TPA: YceH family protein [Terriglobales bacterium]|nr:YceH family protein [Terriglobales bacterium]